MKTNDIDDLLVEWGEQVYKLRGTRGKKGRAVKALRGARLAHPSATAKPSAAGIRQKLRATVRRVPEVLVKISGSGRNTGGIKAHLAYISRTDDHAKREGKELVEFEDEQGMIYRGKKDVQDVMEAWSDGKFGIRKKGKSARESFNIVLSMPPGTHREGFKLSAREFAQEKFSKHQWVIAAHTDEPHPHAHLCVKAVDFDGFRLNPRKKDLQQWRELFAVRLREHGITANATPRRARGVTKKGLKQVVRRIDAKSRAGLTAQPSRATLGQQMALRGVLTGGQGVPVNPAAAHIAEGRKQTVQAYGQIAQALAQSEDTADKRLAVDIAAYVRSMPLPKTRFDTMLEEARGSKPKHRDDLTQER
jgi:hypothetical protein